MRYCLCLGSNLEDREKKLDLARSHLEQEGIRIVQSSSIYESQPVDHHDQPWFLNQVLEVEADLSPDQVLERVKKIETEMKRVTTVPKGPRIIDIDILLAGQSIIRSRELEIPHPRMHRRNFVLVPLCEIAPDVVHPVFKKTLKKVLHETDDTAEVHLFKPRNEKQSK